MSANIAMDALSGKALARYVGKPPWHRLGEVRPDDQPMTPEEASEGISDYEVTTAPLYMLVDGEPVEVPDNVATYRADTRQPLGIVSTGYKVIQNITPMRMLMKIVETKEAGIVAHAVLGRGERLFAVLDLKRLSDIRLPGDPSRHDAFLVAQWWHDGTGALSFGPSMIRTECQNMANAQLRYADRKGMLVRITHVGDIEDQLEQARSVLGYAERSIERYIDVMKGLAASPVPSAEKAWVDGFLERLIPIPADAQRPAHRLKAREAIEALWSSSPTLVGIPHSAYRMKQAVDEYADHYRPVRTQDEDRIPARRFTQIVDGPAAELKRDAERLLCEEFEVHA